MDTLIQLDDINKSYRSGKTSHRVLTGFTHVFYDHCFTILAGPSGSGKSSLLNILATLDRPDSGTYTLLGRPVDYHEKTHLTAIRKNYFGFVFQSFNLIPVLNALENVELPLTLFDYAARERRQMAAAALSLVGLGDRLKSRPAEMSGGEQQRVAIARAIARHPRIVFADEPTANLDKENALHIVRLMKTLNKEEGINFIIASHDDKVIREGKEIIRLGD